MNANTFDTRLTRLRDDLMRTIAIAATEKSPQHIRVASAALELFDDVQVVNHGAKQAAPRRLPAPSHHETFRLQRYMRAHGMRAML